MFIYFNISTNFNTLTLNLNKMCLSLSTKITKSERKIIKLNNETKIKMTKSHKIAITKIKKYN